MSELSKNRRAKSAMAALVALSIFVPLEAAFAADMNWAGAAATYASSKASGDGPNAKEEYGQCAAFWEAWVNKALDAHRLPQEAVVLGDDLIGRGGRVFALAWKTMADLDISAMSAREKTRPMAEGAVDKALGGDAETMRGLMGVLGSCSIFKD